MQLKHLLPTILLGIAAVCSADVTPRHRLRPVAGNLTTPDGSILSYRLYNHSKAAGTPIVLVSGLDQLQDDWQHIMPHFARKHPGIGQSSVTNYSLVTLNNMADDIHQLTQKLGWKNINLVGISMGSVISETFMASNVSDVNVEHLVLIAAGYHNSSSGQLHTDVPRWLSEIHLPPNASDWQAFQHKLWLTCLTPEFIKNHPERVKVFLKEIDAGQNRNFAAFIAQSNALAYHNLTESLTKITTPTLILHGTKDVAFLVENGREIHALIPGSKYIEYPSGGHILFETNPEIVPAILNFLKSK
ncbi:Alpha/Beta hydrolase protein [Gamsiella multidivaricata]|uniref:Alpha/Beta hydrolase protein n=1 Tax=Gamsiella multidivaricata TaxID=101098 RepID=UPI00221EF05F|nr:Alpha/Beta hydrolase protein [Gamsiella multidivaricata]KAG0356911.1 hypothetical protein BGZ54_000559 [Gamsiella multidivaricata]KAI7821985.1 Alpha/Beta hydrolase protein [Gamsiella multidivaricata]